MRKNREAVRYRVRSWRHVERAMLAVKIDTLTLTLQTMTMERAVLQLYGDKDGGGGATGQSVEHCYSTRYSIVSVAYVVGSHLVGASF